MRRGLSRHSNKSSGNFFSPIALFAGGVNGVWYDPSDSATLFSDTAGTTPSPAPGAGALSVVGKMLDKSGNGNHAISYNTTTARPELSARVNLLTYSEQFDNAAWVKAALTVTANSTTAPDGTLTADTLIEGSGAVQPVIYQTLASLAGVVSFYVRSNGRNFVQVVNSASYANFDLSNGTVGSVSGFTNSTISSVGSGWYRISTVIPSSTVVGVALIGSGTSTYRQSYTGDGTSGIYIWGADLRPANIGTSVPAYQRIADQYTYDSSGFPRYLVFNGTASGMYTPANLDLSGTAQATVFAGVRKTTTTTGIVAETSAIASSNNGAFLGLGTDSGGIEFFAGSRGTAYIDVYGDSASYTSPFSAVTTAAFNIAAPSAQLRVNAVVTETDVGSQGTGNYGSYPLNIGGRNVSSGTPSFPFPGYLYSLIVVGAASTAAQISSTESWINGKEGGVY